MTMLKTKSSKSALTGAVAVLVLTACDMGGTRLETRTFRVEHLGQSQSMELIDPYVYGDRADHPGAISVTEGAVTVRETADNLDRIERVLAEFDQPVPDVRLHFQLIEANGFTERDPRIEAVEAELRRLFQFRGYRLAAESTVLASDHASVSQGMRSADAIYEVSANVDRLDAETTRLSPVWLSSDSNWQLTTSVTITNGQTIVLGTSPGGDRAGTLFLTVRADASTPTGAEREQ